MSSASRREKFGHKLGWVEDGGNQGHYDPMLAEIIHDPHIFTGKFDVSSIFLNPALIRVSELTHR